LNIAKQYLIEASKLLEREDLLNVAEKIWATIKHATIALTLRVLGKVGLQRGFHGDHFGVRVRVEPVHY